MANKFSVIWGKKSQPDLRLVPIDDVYYADTADAAKEAARGLLAPLKMTDMAPVGVLELSEEDVEKLVLSDREVHAIPSAEGTTAANDELEFIQLAP